MALLQPISMPKLGLTMTEGVLASWNVAVGDIVGVGDVIFVVETDKISNEIEAAEAGVIAELHAQPGDVVPVGGVVAMLRRESSGGEAGLPSTPVSVAEPRRRIATPLARRMAARSGLDIDTVAGSGPRGRITADDVTAAAVLVPVPPAESVAAPRGVVQPLAQYQRVVARRLTEAKRDIPHFYVFADADVTELLKLRAGLNADPACLKLTINHFIITAVARALAALPAFNRVWSDEGLVERAQIDVGVAIEGPKGLVAPVLRDLGSCGLEEVASAAARLVDRARTGKLAQVDLDGGATAVSNVGMFGATGLLPIVNPGQSSILGVGRSQPTFRPDAHDQPVLRQIINLSLSCDHRVIDGALAARFLQAVQAGLEAPWALLRRPNREPAA